MEGIPFYKKLLSYLYPVLLRRGKGAVNPLLSIYLHQGRLQLATHDALYSDGDKYRPLIAAFKELGTFPSSVSNVLVLGTGLGSAVNILHSRDIYPAITLVDNDEVVLQWAMEYMDTTHSRNITPICDDAQQFVAKNTDNYDMTIVDVFSGRVAVWFVTTLPFLENCRARTVKGGRVIINYIVNETAEWQQALQNFQTVFPQHQLISIGINRIFVATV